MNQSLPLVLGLAAAGAIGAAAATLLQPSAPASSQEAGALAPSTSTAPTRESVAALEQHIEQLTQRIELLESAPSANIRQAALEIPPSFDPELVQEALAKVLSEQHGGQSGLQNLVLDTLDMREAQEEAERELEREQRRQDGIQRYVDRLAEDLELYGDQPQQLYAILDQESLRRDELRDLMRDGQATFDDMTQLRDDTRVALEGVLTQTQLEKYEETNRFRGFGGGGNRAGGFGGRGGGGQPGGGL